MKNWKPWLLPFFLAFLVLESAFSASPAQPARPVIVSQQCTPEIFADWDATGLSFDLKPYSLGDLRPQLLAPGTSSATLYDVLPVYPAFQRLGFSVSPYLSPLYVYEAGGRFYATQAQAPEIIGDWKTVELQEVKVTWEYCT